MSTRFRCQFSLFQMFRMSSNVYNLKSLHCRKQDDTVCLYIPSAISLIVTLNHLHSLFCLWILKTYQRTVRAELKWISKRRHLFPTQRFWKFRVRHSKKEYLWDLQSQKKTWIETHLNKLWLISWVIKKLLTTNQ